VPSKPSRNQTKSWLQMIKQGIRLYEPIMKSWPNDLPLCISLMSPRDDLKRPYLSISSHTGSSAGPGGAIVRLAMPCRWC